MRRLFLSLLALSALWALARPLHAQGAGSGEYVVRAGDTLLAIALRHNTTVQELVRLNRLSNPDQLQIGQRLRLPDRGSPASNVSSQEHIVRAGDTLLAIALRHNTTVQELVRLNGLSNPDQLQIGQRLRLPSNAAPSPSAPASPAAPPPQAPTLQPVTTAADDIAAMRLALLAYHNQVRAANGVPPLAYSGALEAAAQAHAEDCASRGWCSHIGSDGSRASQRIARVGYDGRFTGENWAWSRTVEQAFQMWYYQEIPDGPHLRNILSPRYTEVGFGIVPRSGGGFFFIANFGGR